MILSSIFTNPSLDAQMYVVCLLLSSFSIVFADGGSCAPFVFQLFLAGGAWFPFVFQRFLLVGHAFPCVFQLFAMMAPSPLLSNCVRWVGASHLSASPRFFNVLVLLCFVDGVGSVVLVLSIVLTWFFMLLSIALACFFIGLSMDFLFCFMVLSMGWH